MTPDLLFQYSLAVAVVLVVTVAAIVFVLKVMDVIE